MGDIRYARPREGLRHEGLNMQCEGKTRLPVKTDSQRYIKVGAFIIKII